jgi:hypothetical protein
MYVIQKQPGHPGGMFNSGHPDYFHLFVLEGGVIGYPIGTLADERLAIRIRDLLNQHGMEGIDLALIELPPPAYVGASDDDDDEDAD